MNKPKLLDRVRSAARPRHLSPRTEEAYWAWIKRFILFHRKRHPSEMGAEEIRQFLSHLAVSGRVAASTQNQALCALLFLYRDVLQVDLPYVDGIERAKRPARVPVVFTRQEVGRLLAQLSGTYRLAASLLYGSGLRLMEALRLRGKDFDFEDGQIAVRAGRVGRILALESAFNSCWWRASSPRVGVFSLSARKVRISPYESGRTRRLPKRSLSVFSCP